MDFILGGLKPHRKTFIVTFYITRFGYFHNFISFCFETTNFLKSFSIVFWYHIFQLGEIILYSTKPFLYNVIGESENKYQNVKVHSVGDTTALKIILGFHYNCISSSFSKAVLHSKLEQSGTSTGGFLMTEQLHMFYQILAVWLISYTY